jgi:hypothetical protein
MLMAGDRQHLTQGPRPRIPDTTVRRSMHEPTTWARHLFRAFTAGPVQGRTETTRKVYAGAWSQWVRWCAGRGLRPKPADPATVCAYLTECADRASHCPPSTWPARPSGTSRPPRPARPDRPRRGPPGPPRPAPDRGQGTAPPGPPDQPERPAPDRHRRRPHHLIGCPRYRPDPAQLRRSPATLLAGRAHPRRPRGQARRPAAAPAPLRDRPRTSWSGRRRRPRPASPHRARAALSVQCARKLVSRSHRSEVDSLLSVDGDGGERED